MKESSYKGRTTITYEALEELLGLNSKVTIESIVVDQTRGKMDIVYRSEDAVASGHTHTRLVHEGMEIPSSDYITRYEVLNRLERGTL